MVLLHEWSHSTLAWIFNAKDNPFDIHYGGWLLFDVDEAVNYLALYNEGKTWIVAAIAFLPVVVNATIYALCLWFLSFPAIQSNRIIYTFLFWFTLVNLGEVYSYIPIRTFASHGDVGNFIKVLNISPWIVFIPGVLFVGIATWHLLRYSLPQTYYFLDIKPGWQRIFYLFLALLTYFYWYGHSGAYSYGIVSQIFSWASVAFIPFIFIACYPSRKRVD
jgi:hypothetical protein